MKKSLLLIATAILTLNGFSQTPPDYVSTDGLVGWWPFNGNADDESANSNNGTVNGATLTTDRDGNANTAYDFDGVNDLIEIPHHPSLDFSNSSHTVSLWVDVNTLPMDNLAHHLVYKADYSSGGPNGFRIWLKNGAIVYYFGNGSYSTAKSIGTALNTGWSSIIFTNDKSDLKIYVDGTLITTITITGSLIGNADNSPLYFGGPNIPNTSTDGYLDGILDDIGIWNRALTDCEIQELYNSQLTSLDNTVTQTGNTLSANQTGATYQWLDCDDNDAVIAGATNQDYSSGVSGNYKVEITVTDGACTKVDSSECKSFTFVGLEENKQNQFSVYPNPVKESLTLELNQVSNTGFIITDQLGKVVREGNISSQKQDIDVSSLPKGVYVISVGEVNQKFIKE